jgi:hypothetical protein
MHPWAAMFIDAAPEQVLHLGVVSGMLPAADVFQMGMERRPCCLVLPGQSWTPCAAAGQVHGNAGQNLAPGPFQGSGPLVHLCSAAPTPILRADAPRPPRPRLADAVSPYPPWRPTAAEFSHATALAAADPAIQDASITRLAGGIEWGPENELIRKPVIIRWMNPPMKSPRSGPVPPQCLGNAGPAVGIDPGLASAAAAALSPKNIVQDEGRTPKPLKCCTQAMVSHPLAFPEAGKEELRPSSCLYPHSASLHPRCAMHCRASAPP